MPLVITGIVGGLSVLCGFCSMRPSVHETLVSPPGLVCRIELMTSGTRKERMAKCPPGQERGWWLQGKEGTVVQCAIANGAFFPAPEGSACLRP